MWLFGTEVNVIWCLLFFLAVFISFFGVLVNFCRLVLPSALVEAFLYGKTRAGESKTWIVRFIEVPKSYYFHYYVFALTLYTALWWCCYSVYGSSDEVSDSEEQVSAAPSWLLSALDFMATSKRRPNTSSEAAWLALTLMIIHCTRRLYECLCVNVRNTEAKMNLLHHAAGFAHYLCVGFGIVAEAPGFEGGPVGVSGRDHALKGGVHWLSVHADVANVTAIQWLAAAVFLWAGFHQNASHKILAGIRKGNDQKGNKVYGIPRGGWFRYVSCPHYTAEVLAYLCLATILGPRHQTGLFIFVWVAINQTTSALMSHFWYQDKFKDYPKERRAIFPYLI